MTNTSYYDDRQISVHITGMLMATIHIQVLSQLSTYGLDR